MLTIATKRMNFFSGWKQQFYAAACFLMLCSGCLSSGKVFAQSTKTQVPSTQCQSSFLLRLQDLKAIYEQSKAQYVQERDHVTSVSTIANVKSQFGHAAEDLGLHLQQMGRYAEALPVLQEAVDVASAELQRSQSLIALANVQVEIGRRDLAQQAYQEAMRVSPQSTEVALSVALNRLTLMHLSQITRLEESELQGIARQVQLLGDTETKARFLTQYVLQAKRSGKVASAQLEVMLQQALKISQSFEVKYLQVEILDQYAQLLEDARRDAELMRVSDQAILLLQQIDAPELMIAIEARRARVFARHQQTANAIQSYRVAVRYIEAIRQDIPVSYSQGRSSVREIIDPVYLGLADALLKDSEQAKHQEQSQLLYQVRDVIEQIKQNQLDEYLGNRCTTMSRIKSPNTMKAGGALSTSNSLNLKVGTAVLYPIIFPDRLELLLETSTGIDRYRVDISAQKLNQDVAAFSSALRSHQSFQTLSRRLHKVLLAPLEQSLAQAKIKTLVVVPDGVLRLLAFSALHDGRQYAIEKYAIAISPGLRIIHQDDQDTKGSVASSLAKQVLLAGVSEPGKVVERLPDELVDQLLQTEDLSPAELRGKAARERALQSRNMTLTPMQNLGASLISAEDARAIADKLKQILRLDGVNAEISSLKSLVNGKAILNHDFSSQNFSQQVRSGQFDIVHVASHGIFGSTADKTFILAHDDVITIDQFQSLLSSAQLSKRPLDLLILSACETAEGDDRAPLGISGAALKAKAKSAMGSLWPVSDTAASQLMQSVYQHYVNQRTGKAEALRLAQIELMHQPAYTHPNFWAAFIVVGDWQ